MRPKIIIPVIVIAIAIGSIVGLVTNHKNNTYQTITVTQAYIAQEVDISGTVVPAEQVDLSFEQPGKVATITAKVGMVVEANTVLATLDDTEIQAELSAKKASRVRSVAQLEEQRALRDSEQAKLNELLRGARAEEITLAQTKLDNAKKAEEDARTDLTSTKTKAEVDLNNLYKKTEDITNDAYTKADNAVNQQVEALFNDDNTLDPTLTFTVSDSEAKDIAERARVDATQALARMSGRLVITTTSQPSLDAILIDTESDLKIIRTFLNTLTTAVNSSISLSQDTRDSYHTKINTARTNVNTELTDINTHNQLIAAQKATNAAAIATKETALTTAQNATFVAQDELRLLLAGTPQEQLDAQRARVTQATSAIASQEALITQIDADIANIETRLAQTIMKAPTNGTVTLVDIDAGENVLAQTPVIRIISAADLEIDADIPELYIASIAVQDPARVTLDAYGDNEYFDAQVISIDPAETIVGGVPTYTTTFEFTQKDNRIKPGMTATITIVTQESFNAITVPTGVLSFDDAGTHVRVLVNNKPELRLVTTGIRSKDGNIEITRGLEVGDVVILE